MIINFLGFKGGRLFKGWVLINFLGFQGGRLFAGG